MDSFSQSVSPILRVVSTKSCPLGSFQQMISGKLKTNIYKTEYVSNRLTRKLAFTGSFHVHIDVSCIDWSTFCVESLIEFAREHTATTDHSIYSSSASLKIIIELFWKFSQGRNQSTLSLWHVARHLSSVVSYPSIAMAYGLNGTATSRSV